MLPPISLPMLSRQAAVALAASFLGVSSSANLFAAPIQWQGLHETIPGVTITLWTAEPDVVDPVAICFDASGRVYVAECRDYPYGAGTDGGVGSTIRLLEDTNGDGRADRSVLFAKDLSYATGLTPWRGGILVAAAPDILWLKDTNGDGVADVQKVILTGFKRGVSDSLVNSLRFHLDNRIHGANGGSGGRVAPPSTDETLNLGYDDFAFNPDTGALSKTGASGGGFGLVFDTWGRFFTTYNIDHIQHRFLSRDDASRYPGFPPLDLTASISDHGDMARIFPISKAQTRPNHPEQAGHFSSAGGMGLVESSIWPSELQGSVFVCDVVGNLVHRDVLHEKGSVFVASRAADELDREFFASRDNNFRPVGLETGPDGALYLLDMQRDVIEHPDYIPAAMREKVNIRAGQDRGRIYRLIPSSGKMPIQPVRLEAASNSDLVKTLGHTDPWWRLTAQRLLIEREAKSEVPALKHALRHGARSEERLHALWTLVGFRELTADDLLFALEISHKGVLENALIIAGTLHLNELAIHQAVAKLTTHPEARIRFQAARALGNRPGPDATAALVSLLDRDFADQWTRHAIWSAIPPNEQRLALQQVLTRRRFLNPISPGTTDVLRELAELIGARASVVPTDIGWVIQQLRFTLSPNVRLPLLTGLTTGLGRSGTRPEIPPAAQRHLNLLYTGAPQQEMRQLWQLSNLLGLPETPAQKKALQAAIETSSKPTADLHERIENIALLEFGQSSEILPILFKLLEGTEPPEIQKAALSILRKSSDPITGQQLVKSWPELSPTLRAPALQLLLDRRPFHEPLMAAIESGDLTIGELNLDLEQRRRLLRQSTPDIRERAARFISDEEYANRNAVIDEWLLLLPEAGNVARGKVVFTESCARCHKSGGEGWNVGPDLTNMSHRSIEDLLGNILDPNMAIAPAYVAYEAETSDGESHVGLLALETPDSITLLQAMETRVIVPRNQLVRLRSTGRSLMPDGLEAVHTPQDLRDLIEFLQSATP